MLASQSRVVDRADAKSRRDAAMITVPVSLGTSPTPGIGASSGSEPCDTASTRKPAPHTPSPSPRSRQVEVDGLWCGAARKTTRHAAAAAATWIHDPTSSSETSTRRGPDREGSEDERGRPRPTGRQLQSPVASPHLQCPSSNPDARPASGRPGIAVSRHRRPPGHEPGEDLPPSFPRIGQRSRKRVDESERSLVARCAHLAAPVRHRAPCTPS